MVAGDLAQGVADPRQLAGRPPPGALAVEAEDHPGPVQRRDQVTQGDQAVLRNAADHQGGGGLADMKPPGDDGARPQAPVGPVAPAATATLGEHLLAEELLVLGLGQVRQKAFDIFLEGERIGRQRQGVGVAHPRPGQPDGRPARHVLDRPVPVRRGAPGPRRRIGADDPFAAPRLVAGEGVRSDRVGDDPFEAAVLHEADQGDAAEFARQGVVQGLPGRRQGSGATMVGRMQAQAPQDRAQIAQQGGEALGLQPLHRRRSIGTGAD